MQWRPPPAQLRICSRVALPSHSTKRIFILAPPAPHVSGGRPKPRRCHSAIDTVATSERCSVRFEHRLGSADTPNQAFVIYSGRLITPDAPSDPTDTGGAFFRGCGIAVASVSGYRRGGRDGGRILYRITIHGAGVGPPLMTSR